MVSEAQNQISVLCRVAVIKMANVSINCIMFMTVVSDDDFFPVSSTCYRVPVSVGGATESKDGSLLCKGSEGSLRGRQSESEKT